jgi:hypothetical protein
VVEESSTLSLMGDVPSFFLATSFGMFDFLTRWCNGKLLSALRVHGASLSVSSDTAVRRWTFMLKWSILS